MEVAASEPLIASPTGFCWDERGRMFVCELHGYNLEGHLEIEELNKSGRLDTQVRRVQADERFKKAAAARTFGVVKLLQDKDGDGRMDAAEVWASDLPPAYGIAPARGGVIVACAPDIILLADPDGDGRPEVREKLFTGFQTGALERSINAPQWGADGWIYFGRGWGGGTITGARLAEPVVLPDSDFRIRADGTAIEPVVGGTHTFGFAMVPAGDRFVVNTTAPAIHAAPLPWRYLERNPDVILRTPEFSSGDSRVWQISEPHPWRRKRAEDPEYSKFYRERYGAAESDAAGWFTGACGPFVYLDRTLPGLHGQYFVCEPAGNLIHRAEILAKGTALGIRRIPGEEQSEFAASTDAWCHPIYLAHGPDGAIWIADYYREIIEDYSAIPRHLQQQYGLYAGHDRGRIYRLTHRDLPQPRDAALHGMDAAQLASELLSPSMWRRQTAQRLLIERSNPAAAPLVRARLSQAESEPLGFITALHTLNQLGALTPEDIQPALTHGDAAVRVHAFQLADPFFISHAALFDAALDAASLEASPRVLLQAALSLGESRDPRAFAALARLASTVGDLPWMDAALLSSLRENSIAMIEHLLREPGRGGKLIAPLAASVAARGDAAEVQRLRELAATASGETPGILNAALASVRPLVQRPQDASAFPENGPPRAAITEETFRTYIEALGGERDLQKGQQIFSQSCAICHRIGTEGFYFGPDLVGELAVAEETLLRHLLIPEERIRPGYETTEVSLRDGSALAGILRQDGATSMTLALPGGIERSVLKKDVASTRRVPHSLMPSFAGILSPQDAASLLAWLRSRLGPEPPAGSP
jgi:putative membrane-bound dehydrogenase-like protein